MVSGLPWETEGSQGALKSLPGGAGGAGGPRGAKGEAQGGAKGAPRRQYGHLPNFEETHFGQEGSLGQAKDQKIQLNR